MTAPPQTYLILIKDDGLALAVGEALEERLSKDGHSAAVLVPAVRGADFADVAADWLSQARRLDPSLGSRLPHLVALYQDGLLERLEPLGLRAYVGVPLDQQWQAVPWGKDSGAMLLPVATARDMIEAVAAHTPWSLGAKATAVAGLLPSSDHGRS